MDRNLPRKSSYRSASSSSSRSSTSYSNRRYGANPARYSGQNPARTHDHRSRSVSEGDRESRMESPIGQLEGEHEVKDCFDAQSIVGTCPFMCPEKERNQREQLRDLAVFERLDGNPRRTSSSLAVKKFCRTISTKDVQASDLRPLPVLEDTLNYLMKLLDSSDHPFEVVHDFIFDRTRSIRQDLSMQNIFSDRVIWMYEKMVKFHVISHYKLRRCKGDCSIISSIHHLNKEQLTKCLASLYNLYEVNRSSESIHANEAEFRSLFHCRANPCLCGFRVYLLLLSSQKK
uniref:SAC3/GANP/THP3 conserved domain-containing protein n=1 Tax=Opuntia streptacantha TaxID=393608 RepID=A0A7C9D7Q1_OPUST